MKYRGMVIMSKFGSDTVKKDNVGFIGWMVILAFVLNVIFTTVILYIFFYTGSEPSTLIVAWFGFTTGEIVVGGAIQRKKYDIEYGKKQPHQPPPPIFTKEPDRDDSIL